MDFMEVMIENSIIVNGAATGMGLDSEGKVFYVLQVTGLNKESEIVTIHIVIPPMSTEHFLRVVNSIGTKSE